MGTYLCCCTVMYRGTLRSWIAIVQQGLALVWVYLIFFKIIMFGLLFWGVDVADARQCDYLQNTCETNENTIARILANQFKFFDKVCVVPLECGMAPCAFAEVLLAWCQLIGLP